MIGIITEICQTIDVYNIGEKAKKDLINKSKLRSKIDAIRIIINQFIFRKRLLHIINKIKDKPLNVDIMNDFFRNYNSTIDFIVLNNCECIEERDQFLFSIKTDNVNIVYSTRKLNNQTISVSAKWKNDIYVRNSTYHDYFKDNEAKDSLENIMYYSEKCLAMIRKQGNIKGRIMFNTAFIKID